MPWVAEDLHRRHGCISMKDAPHYRTPASPVTDFSRLSPAEPPQLLPAACTAPTFLPSFPRLPGTWQQTSEQKPAVEKDVAKLPLTATDTAEVLEEESHLPPRAGSGREASGRVTGTGR